MVSCRQCRHCYDIKERIHPDHTGGHAHNYCRLYTPGESMDTDYDNMGRSYGMTHYSKCIFSSIRRSKDINVNKIMEDGGAM